jgi:hypothetical protein
MQEWKALALLRGTQTDLLVDSEVTQAYSRHKHTISIYKRQNFIGITVRRCRARRDQSQLFLYVLHGAYG